MIAAADTRRHWCRVAKSGWVRSNNCQFGLGVFSMARRHALVSLRHALVSLRHAAPSQRHAAPFFFFFFFNFLFLGLLIRSIIMWMKTDDKLTNFMTYGGSYTSVLLDFSVQCPGPGQLLQTVSSSFIGPGLLIRQPLFYDFTVADPWLFAQSLKHPSRTANMASSFTPSQQCSSLTDR